MKKRRVVITGIGAIAPNGLGKDAFWEALKAGRSGVGQLTHVDAAAYPVKIAGQVNDFDPSLFMDGKKARRLKRFSQFAVAAAKMAVGDAKYPLQD
ncbi:MAG: beta-ketoacyl synthase N-terminal-like domain-containing protein, partial [bacterium]|nr:beta-ketoacyl synthase N-terminal-like domain-containing protein [bacterium]